MRAVDICIGHDDNLVITQIIQPEFRAKTHAQRLTQVRDFCICSQFGRGGAQNVQDLATQWQKCLIAAVAGHLGTAPGRVPLDDEQLCACARCCGAINQLAGKTQLLGGAFAAGFLFLTAAQPFF